MKHINKNEKLSRKDKIIKKSFEKIKLKNIGISNRDLLNKTRKHIVSKHVLTAVAIWCSGAACFLLGNLALSGDVPGYYALLNFLAAPLEIGGIVYLAKSLHDPALPIDSELLYLKENTEEKNTGTCEDTEKIDKKVKQLTDNFVEKYENEDE